MPRLLPILLAFACAHDYEFVPEAPDVDPGDVTECGFSRVGDTDFWSYDCNPVFTTSGEPWAPAIGSTAFGVTEVVSHPFYQLWYIGEPGDVMGDWGLGYAVSADGTEWESYPANPLLEGPTDARAWNWSGVGGMQAVWNPRAGRYLILYQGYNVDPRSNSWGLGVMTSPDGVAWTQSDSNPVMDLLVGRGSVSQWCWPLGLSLGATSGYVGYVAGSERPDGPCDMYEISASDADTWTPEPARVMQGGSPGSWNDQGFISASVAFLDDTFYMFYVGFGDWEVYDTYKSSLYQFLGVATSSNGVDWNRHDEVIPVNQTEKGEVGSVAAWRVGSRIHLWISDVWDGASGVGYFLFDPGRGTEDTGG